MPLPRVKTVPYTAFTIRALPKPWYQFLQQVRATYHLTHWQVILAGLECVRLRGSEDEAALRAIVEDIRQRFPAKDDLSQAPPAITCE